MKAVGVFMEASFSNPEPDEAGAFHSVAPGIAATDSLPISGRLCGQARLRRSSSASATRGIAHSNCCGLPRSKHPISPGFLSRRGRHYDRPHDGATAHRAWPQTGRQTGQQDPGAHRRGAPQALAPRHLGGRKVAVAGLRRLAQLLCRPGVGPVHPCIPPQAATPVDAGAALAVPTRPLQLGASGAHDRNPLATSFNPPPMAGPAVCRQSPEVGAGWFSDHAHSYRDTKPLVPVSGASTGAIGGAPSSSVSAMTESTTARKASPMSAPSSMA